MVVRLEAQQKLSTFKYSGWLRLFKGNWGFFFNLKSGNIFIRPGNFQNCTDKTKYFIYEPLKETSQKYHL